MCGPCTVLPEVGPRSVFSTFASSNVECTEKVVDLQTESTREKIVWHDLVNGQTLIPLVELLIPPEVTTTRAHFADICRAATKCRTVCNELS